MAERRSDNLYIAPDVDDFAKIRVIGVGGGGCNAVDRMIESNVQGIEFIAVNTDYQVIARSKAPVNLQIGDKVTRGLGAGADPQKGEMAANESRDEIAKMIQGTDMLFITAGMGGGTGTGAAPVIASIAKDMGILTVGVVTRPFGFEGAARKNNAEAGIQQLESFVDSLIVVPNDKLLEIADDDMGLEEAFAFADQVLKYGVAGISDLVAIPGMINLDLADVRRVMLNAGICHMGIGRASGENRASVAIDEAIHSPLLDTTIDGARRVIINFTGSNMKLKEISLATSLVRDAVAPDADIIFGAVPDPHMEDELMITVIASGFTDGERKGRSAQGPDLLRSNRSEGRTSSSETVPNFLNQLRRETQQARESHAGASPAPASAPAPTQRPTYGSGRSTYTPLTSEPTDGRSTEAEELPRTQLGRQAAQSKWPGGYRGQANSHPAPASKEAPQEKKSGILPWFFSDNDDHLED